MVQNSIILHDNARSHTAAAVKDGGSGTSTVLTRFAQTLDWYQREGDDFLGRIVAMDKTWAHSYKPNLKRQSNEWKHPGSPRPKKVRPTQSAVKEMFIVAYDIDGVILHHTVPPRQMESHRCGCHGPLALLAMADSGTSTVLTRYASMRLRSLRQSERTTVRDLVQYQR
ncbi:hypothetical protein ANN_01453 [Periplaneta americana]|uniref:Mariner Mos1 transposase n=1 Tax=Periplaneta americana TaxID=6978 RepID=A0ABQ8TW16_PERAM|nr:hypothetical protein ANN_01453 [Periplaneta americana]